jgi:hypothetical protein
MALHTPLYGASPLATPGFHGHDEGGYGGGYGYGDDGAGGGGSLFVATERSAAADAQLQRDARVESLQRRWAEARAARAARRAGTAHSGLTCARVRARALHCAQVANAFQDWLEDTLLLVSERWPVLDGSTRLDVRGRGADAQRPQALPRQAPC